MAKPASLALDRGSGALNRAQAPIVVSASLFVALCARVTVPLPFTPVPVDLAEFWRAPGRPDFGKPPRLCGPGALPGGRSLGHAGV